MGVHKARLDCKVILSLGPHLLKFHCKIQVAIGNCLFDMVVISLVARWPHTNATCRCDLCQQLLAQPGYKYWGQFNKTFTRVIYKCSYCCEILKQWLQYSIFEFAMTSELKKWRRVFHRLSLDLKLYIHKFQREKDPFITLSIVYSQISNTYLPECLNILLYVEATQYECVVNICIQR